MLTDVHADSAKKVPECVFSQDPPGKGAGVMKEEHIHLKYATTKGGKADHTLCLHKVTYRDEQGRVTLIAHLLLTVLKRKAKSEKAFSTVAALIRIHFISHLNLY